MQWSRSGSSVGHHVDFNQVVRSKNLVFIVFTCTILTYLDCKELRAKHLPRSVSSGTKVAQQSNSRVFHLHFLINSVQPLLTYITLIKYLVLALVELSTCGEILPKLEWMHSLSGSVAPGPHIRKVKKLSSL